LITCIPADEIDFEIGHFSQISDLHDLDLDLGSGHTAYRHLALIDLYLKPNFVEIGKTFYGQMYVQVDTENQLYQTNSEE